MPLPIHHLALRTRDLARLEEFYARVFAFPVRKRDDGRGSVWLDAEGVILMLERADVGEPVAPPGTRDLMAFAIDDRDEWRARLTAAGVVIEDETPHTLYFRDPDGRRLGVSTYRERIP